MRIKAEMNKNEARRMVKAYQLLLRLDRVLDNDKVGEAANTIQDMFPISDWVYSGEDGVPEEFYDFIDWAIEADVEELLEVMMEERPKRWTSGC